jgi:hypothetical protein
MNHNETVVSDAPCPHSPSELNEVELSIKYHWTLEEITAIQALIAKHTQEAYTKGYIKGLQDKAIGKVTDQDILDIHRTLKPKTGGK